MLLEAFSPVTTQSCRAWASAARRKQEGLTQSWLPSALLRALMRLAAPPASPFCGRAGCRWRAWSAEASARGGVRRAVLWTSVCGGGPRSVPCCRAAAAGPDAARAPLAAACAAAWVASFALVGTAPVLGAALPARDVDVVAAAVYYNARNSPARARAASPAPTASEVADAKALLATARGCFEARDYAAALEAYTAVATRHPGLALAHSARLNAALLLFETGLRERALLELESEVALVGAGNAQLHAALAVVVHATRPAQLARAESEWDTAVSLAPRFDDEAWVAQEKAWPPAMLAALHSFLKLE